MTRWSLLRKLDATAIEKAIADAEIHTSGEIRISIAGFFRGDLRGLAERAFSKLAITATRHRNGVLIMVAPTRRAFTILGDVGIHARVGQSFWTGLADILAARFRAGDFTGGLVEAILNIGRELALHFPPDPGDNPNEREDTIDLA